MREILFRGKTNKGEWVEGLLWKKKYNTNKLFISCFPDKDDNEEVFVVRPETIGQYTGFTDKNGKKIFEGDVVLNDFFTRYFRGVVNFGKHNPNDADYDKCTIGFFIEWENDMLRNDLFSWIEKDTLEIIGNIHDNPELLKGE